MCRVPQQTELGGAFAVAVEVHHWEIQRQPGAGRVGLCLAPFAGQLPYVIRESVPRESP
jgi:hypothetical protein